jgi:hypothetical protein
MNAESGFGLSPEGMARKDAIFEKLAHAQRQRTTRRRTVRIGVAAMALGAAGVAGWAGLQIGGVAGTAPGLTRSGPSEPQPRAISGPIPAEGPGVRVQIVANDPTVMARLVVTGDPGRAAIIGDGELDRWLVRAGRAPGSIRTPGRFILASEIPPPRGPGSG